MSKIEKKIIELSSNTDSWTPLLDLAVAEQRYCLVHPSVLLSFLRAYEAQNSKIVSISTAANNMRSEFNKLLEETSMQPYP